MNKIEKVQRWLADNNRDIALISDPKTIQYLTGFFSDPNERVLVLVVFKNKEPFLFGPALETEAIKESGWSQPVYGYLDHEDPWQMIADQIRTRQTDQTAFAIEKANLSVAWLEQAKSQFPNGDFSANLTPMIDQMRMIKTPDEIEKLKIAGKWDDFAFKTCFEAVKAGLPESRVAAEMSYALMKNGIMELSFPALIQSATHAAEPHGATSDKKIENNALVLFDLGTVWDGYISDATRTIAVGKPDAKSLDIYKVCLEAQLAAQNAAKPGITAAELDKVARDIITKAGYGEYFNHRLGHGMGMSEHEFPSIMAGNDLVLQPGMCFSIEPGIYIPDVAGVRIEDCIHITENGNEPFTHTTKELQYFG
ncbi:M24 family metallopeptidase [Lentilactobacillus farraginis]|uniref:Xaa-Pro dipeptidase n=3 Tax=Lentilactobacillus farraginis DSM 18382 = JCM 14108 TaxID=1423743 RepID=A0A0R1VX28_9LACO|nr:Xaa-Pro peptidase family protein [Lentilactobacillus farraginis]KRM10034.1 Xaa-Pro dipeptidase [Lentilactobacillus farraginis DSM 18382 = JCM 14108]